MGDWANKDFSTRDLTRIHIWLEGTNVMARVWGRCHPAECDWGEATATVNGQKLSLDWDQKFAAETPELTLLAGGSLQVKGHRHFTDNSGRTDFGTKDVLVKGLVHDWSDPVPE